jgi:cell division protein FtsQ
MKRINWNNIRLVVIFGLMIFLYSFSGIRNDKRIVQKNKIIILPDDQAFLNETIVNNLLIQNLDGTSDIAKEKVDLFKLESLLNANEYVEKAEVFCTIDGVLEANVIQKKPLIRVVSDQEAYYLDNKGNVIPLAYNFTPRVPLYYGKIEEKDSKELVTLFSMINQDEMLKQNIIDVSKTKRGNFVFSVRDYKYKVLLGSLIDVEKKLKNYKAFLQYAAKDTLLNEYKVVNLIFTQQVVCSK